MPEDNLSAKGFILRYKSKPERCFFLLQPIPNFYNERALLWQRENKLKGHSSFAAKQIQVG